MANYKVQDLTPQEVSKGMAEGRYLLVDVREPAEWEIVRIPDAVLIPKGELPSKLADLPQDKPVVLYCKSGVRSAEALALLKDAGFADAKHVQGGVTAWQTQVLGDEPLY